MADEIKKMDLRSMDVTVDRIEQLKAIFPEAVTEGKVDFEKLKRSLGEAVEAGVERYGMNWAGKSDCFRIIQQPSVGTLKPVRDDSANFDETENLFIEGDSLEVLKLLQKSYYGKIKLIYIDPPYNTGKDFIYPDNYTESLDTYLKYTGQVDDEGRKYSTNTDAEGRFHTKWINMMYPRLYLARNLLRDDGVIFISIDNNEVDNLKKICNEVYGEENFIACIANVNNPKGRSDDKYIATAHEYLLVYKKRDINFRGWAPGENIIRRYNKTDKNGERYREIDLRKTGDNDRREDRPNLFYYFYYAEKTKEFYPSRDEDIPKDYIQIIPLREDGSHGNWRWELKTVLERKERLYPKFMPVRKVWSVFEMDYLDPNERVKPTSAWTKKDFNSERGSEEFINLGFDKNIFPRPKPIGLIKHILEASTEPKNGDIVLDFFAGSCTTAQALYELNTEDQGDRRYICIQLPELCDETSDAYKAGYKSIAEIGKERIRRAINAIEADAEGKLEFDKSGPALGFKIFKLDKSNFKIWNAADFSDPDELSKQLELHVDHVDPESSQEDILYELLLKSGFELTTKVEKIQLEGKDVFSIAEGMLLICLEQELTKEVIKAMAEKEPARVICLDTGFKNNDQLKTNAVQIMKSKGIEDFLTV